MKFLLVSSCLLASIVGTRQQSPFILPELRGYTYAGETCGLFAPRAQCEKRAEELARQQDKCYGHYVGLLGRIFFKKCVDPPKCEVGTVLVPEDSGPNKLPYPNCCAKCKALPVNHGSTLDCPPESTIEQCRALASRISQKQEYCTGFSFDQSGKVVFQQCTATPQCAPDSVFVPEDTSANRTAYPNCCATCKKYQVKDGSELDCPTAYTHEQCEQYAAVVSQQQNYCTGFHFNEFGKIVFKQCTSTPKCPVGTVFVQEDNSPQRKAFPDCCPSCITPQVADGSAGQCGPDMTLEVCREQAKAIAEKQYRCTGYEIDANGKVLFKQCPAISCPGKFLQEDVSSVNRKQFPQCCAQCLS